MDFVYVTAQYSNAVLLAILPHISDFAMKLELPVVLPVTPPAVRRFVCDPRQGRAGGRVLLTNGVQFFFEDGHVRRFETARSYFSLQIPDRIPEFYGRVTMSKAEAIQLAKATIKKLGYTEAQLYMDHPPDYVAEPEKIGTNVVPRYRFKWLDRDYPDVDLKNGVVSVNIEIDAEMKKVQMLSIVNRSIRRPEPKVDVVAEPVPRPKPPPRGGRPLTPVSPAYSNAFLVAILPQVSDYVRKLGLPIPAPIATDQIDLSRYSCYLLEGKPGAQLYLTNGYRFMFRNGYVNAFYAPDQTSIAPDNSKKFTDYLGPLNMTDAQIAEMGRDALKKLGYSLKTLHAQGAPGMGKPYKFGTNYTSRRWVEWTWPDTVTPSSVVAFEVDATTRSLKSLYVNNTNLWREQTRIDVPLEPHSASPETSNAPAGNLDRQKAQLRSAINRITTDQSESRQTFETNTVPKETLRFQTNIQKRLQPYR